MKAMIFVFFIFTSKSTPFRNTTDKYKRVVGLCRGVFDDVVTLSWRSPRPYKCHHRNTTRLMMGVGRLVSFQSRKVVDSAKDGSKEVVEPKQSISFNNRSDPIALNETTLNVSVNVGRKIWIDRRMIVACVSVVLTMVCCC